MKEREVCPHNGIRFALFPEDLRAHSMYGMCNTMRAAQTTLNMLLQEVDTADLVISCGSKQWFLHSNIIAIRSPFLKAKLADMAGMEMKVIEVENMDPNIMEQAINYMHGIPIVLKVVERGDNNDAHKMLEASERLGMEDMKTEVGEIIGKHLSVQNALELGQQGEMFNNEALLRACAIFIAYNTSIKIGEDQAKESPKLVTRILLRAQQFRESENENKRRGGWKRRKMTGSFNRQ